MLKLANFDLGPALSQFKIVAGDIAADEARELDRLLPETAARARAAAAHWDYLAPARAVDHMLDARPAFPRAKDIEGKTRLRRVTVARLALHHFQVEDPLPPSIACLYPDHLRRLAKFLAEGAGDRYNDEYFAKDVRYALGVTAPCGALQFDLKYHISPKIVLRDALKTKASHLLIAYIGAAAWGRWYNEHIDLRAMREFNPDGWTAHCARMAEMLELNPSVRGIVGVGWFYDPAVAENSPGLAYIRETQMRYGGLLVRIGTEPHHIENAIFRSAVRRRLYEEGKYLPTCYMLAWPRRRLIAWAQRLKVDPSVGFGGSEPLPKSRPVIPARPSNDRQAPAVAR